MLGSSNANKWGDHQKKNQFIDNYVEDLIPFKEEYQDLLKLHVPLGKRRKDREGGGVQLEENNRTISNKGIFFGAEK